MVGCRFTSKQRDFPCVSHWTALFICCLGREKNAFMTDSMDFFFFFSFVNLNLNLNVNDVKSEI